MFTDDQLLPISALQHYLYCPRQAALIHLERAWADNRFTAEGNALHQKAHDGHDESRPGVRVTRSLPVVSRRLGIAGQCDVVEFHTDGTIIPVEYKRSRPKTHDADRAQLCAQSICLEEMQGAEIREGFLFYGQRKRRTQVDFSSTLRELVETAAWGVRDLIVSRVTPTAEYDKRRCDACSLIEFCQPKALRLKRGAAAWFATAVNAEQQTAFTAESET